MSRKSKYEELTAEQLRWRCDPESLKLDSTDDVEACEGIIGQERAIRALRLGLDIKSMGYNIFVTGLVGTGRTKTIKHLLKDLENLVMTLAKDIPGIFESEVYQRRKKEVISSYQERQKKLVSEFEKKVAKEGFALVQVQLGPFVQTDLQPLI